jgi:hypothetical protein
MTPPGERSTVRLPWAAHLPGAVALLGAGLLAARLVWEQTWLTWTQGPQMVGFALVHAGPAFLLLSPVLLGIWVLVLGTTSVVALLGRRRPSRAIVLNLVAAIVIAVVPFVPYGAWQRLFAARLARGPHAAELMLHAAALGDLRTVKAFVAHGVAPGSTSRTGATGLHAAAVGDQVDVLAWFVAQGVAIDATDRYGDSPLENAMDSNSSAAARWLEAHGAHRVHGSAEQLERVTSEIVAEDMLRMEAAGRR